METAETAPENGPSAKRLRFIAEYLIDHNATQAAIRAGYSKRTAYAQGYRLLNYVEVRQEIERREAAILDALGITKGYIIDKLRQNLERAMQFVPVCDKKGNPTGEFKYDGAVANRAAELLGMELRMFKKEVDITSAGQGLQSNLLPVRALKEEELDALIARAERGEASPALPKKSGSVRRRHSKARVDAEAD